MLFLDNFWLLKPPKTRGGCPPTPFHILNFITLFLLSQKTWQFRPQDVSGASFFDGVYDVFCTRLNFYTKQCNIKNYQKITKKTISCWCLAFLGSRPSPQTGPSQGQFLTVFAMFYAHRALGRRQTHVPI